MARWRFGRWACAVCRRRTSSGSTVVSNSPNASSVKPKSARTFSGGYCLRCLRSMDQAYSSSAFTAISRIIYCCMRVINRNEPWCWLWFGLCAGLGLENKHSMLFFGFGIFVGLLLTSARRFFASRWFWLGGGLAFALFLPNIVWEYRHDWATLELLRNVQESGKNVALSPLEFIVQQVLILHPLTLPVGEEVPESGRPDGEGQRMQDENYYLLPIYPMLFAAGAV